jgi:hypothetical protein
MGGNSKLIAAGIIVAIYFIVAGVLLAKLYGTGTTPDWDHVLTIFNAIGALATAAAGVLLGVQIQQSHVDTANSAKQAKADESARKDVALRQALTQLDPTGVGAVADMAAVRGTLRDAIG